MKATVLLVVFMAAFITWGLVVEGVFGSGLNSVIIGSIAGLTVVGGGILFPKLMKE